MKIQVIHKKGDVENVGNYRPICSLPALYKLFSTMLHRRLYPRLDQEQAEDQKGFRSSYQTTDHLAKYRMIEQKCHEWGIKMWTATIDFTKAFDSITHKSIWKALESCGIKHDYISLLKKIYKNQKASVQTDAESNMLEIKKGTKQGDFLSRELSERRHPALATEKRNGNLPERPPPRLPHEPEVCRRRASVRNLQRTASKNVVRFQEKY